MGSGRLRPRPPEEVDPIREALREVDGDDEYEIDDYDAEFIENALHRWCGEMTEAQKMRAARIIERWRGGPMREGDG